MRTEVNAVCGLQDRLLAFRIFSGRNSARFAMVYVCKFAITERLKKRVPPKTREGSAAGSGSPSMSASAVAGRAASMGGLASLVFAPTAAVSTGLGRIVSIAAILLASTGTMAGVAATEKSHALAVGGVVNYRRRVCGPLARACRSGLSV